MEGPKEQKCNRHISHQIGATFAMLLFQTTELMNPFKQPRPAQIINKEVPTFQARGTRIINQFVNITKGEALDENTF